MKGLLTLFLVGCWLLGYAQGPATPQVYANPQAGYQLTYPRAWQLRQNASKTETTFFAGDTAKLAPAVVLIVRLLPGQLAPGTLARNQQDSLWRSVRRLPRSQVLRLDQHDAGSYHELRYDYTFATDSVGATRVHVLGRRVWRGNQEFQLEYRAAVRQEGSALAEGQQVVDSFGFTNQPAGRYPAGQQCDDKMYGIAALRYVNETWEDDCRTIHEFSVTDPSVSPKIHREVLPFQSYALAKGFDNCLYSVTKAPTNAPEYVYRYNPATRQGEYTPWQLPAQGPETVWISAATDERGDLYFSTADASQLVKVSPADNSVTVVWATDPVRQASYYSAIGFAGAGSHGNFCLDDANTLYQIYSTDGSLIKVDLNTRQPAPEMIALEGLPEKGGYSDVLMQVDKAGRRRLFLAGPKSLYRVDLERREAYRVRRGIYTDLAGCNLFQATDQPAREGAPAAPTASAVPPASAVWRGRVLDAATLQPLPQAQLRLHLASGSGGFGPAASLAPDGSFAMPVQANKDYAARVRLVGYLTTDSTYRTLAGPYMQDILLRPFTVGTTLRLDNVQFEQGTTRLLPAAYPALDELLAILKENPKLTIELRGHTDNVGPAEKNQILSEQRVTAIRLYLIGLGIVPKRIRGVGLGGTQPRASNDREVTRQLNRRVEFRITGVQ
ncbi:OmpA family protein [Hymenobacter sp. BT186]|uniref:OmpA family protein n=1 Tax=Hymenobacter telluris TaxID=2816474 RepID=A0A939JCI8_9BACT|nr:OmpA family protein [Hymenobacter telluris]MBO0357883.1 OmpA family protein [Hymenobacter telluris]MBW3373910.1 OmpA family protein [Hymenobacter norwichensis]